MPKEETILQDKEFKAIKDRYQIVGDDPQFKKVVDIALRVAKTDLPVLITGESGVGKENVARIIHDYSSRRRESYLPVNCGGIPDGTIDSELFGHEKGAFTDAESERKGYFEYADGGTIFLDEVGDLPAQTQVRLLRVLQSGDFRRVGSNEDRKVNVRVVSATNLNFEDRINRGLFREDLFYRLNGVTLNIPPLRERKGDIVKIFDRFAADFSTKYNIDPIELTDDARQLLVDYPWPGNIRELKNVAEGLSVMSVDREITMESLKSYLDKLPKFSKKGSNLPVPVSGGGELVLEDSKKKYADAMYVEAMFKYLSSQIESLKAEISKLKNEPAANMNDVRYLIGKEQSGEMPIEITRHASNADDVFDASVVVDDMDTNASIEVLSDEDQKEAERVVNALNSCNGNRKQAATILGITERTLQRKLKKYGLTR